MTLAPENKKSHSKPRITANDLARYMVSSDTGRLGIIRRNREQSRAPAALYSKVRDAAKAYLQLDNRDPAILDKTIEFLKHRSEDPASSKYVATDAKNSITAMRQLPILLDNYFGGYNFEDPKGRSPKLELQGVSVSVNLDLLVFRNTPKQTEVGGVIFRFSQLENETPAAEQKRKEMSAYVATLIHMQVAANYSANGMPSRKLCFAADVQSRDVVEAPKSYVTRAKNLETACRFIAAIWKSV